MGERRHLAGKDGCLWLVATKALQKRLVKAIQTPTSMISRRDSAIMIHMGEVEGRVVFEIYIDVEYIIVWFCGYI
jgi:hypothetical protein